LFVLYLGQLVLAANGDTAPILPKSAGSWPIHFQVRQILGISLPPPPGTPDLSGSGGNSRALPATGGSGASNRQAAASMLRSDPTAVEQRDGKLRPADSRAK